MKFCQLIVRKITKIVACTRCQILRLKCTQIDFGWGSAPDSGALPQTPLKELTALPRTLEKRGPTSMGREGEGRTGRGRQWRGDEWREWKGREEKEGEGTSVCIFKFSLE